MKKRGHLSESTFTKIIKGFFASPCNIGLNISYQVFFRANHQFVWYKLQSRFAAGNASNVGKVIFGRWFVDE